MANIREAMTKIEYAITEVTRSTAAKDARRLQIDSLRLTRISGTFNILHTMVICFPYGLTG